VTNAEKKRILKELLKHTKGKRFFPRTVEHIMGFSWDCSKDFHADFPDFRARFNAWFEQLKPWVIQCDDHWRVNTDLLVDLALPAGEAPPDYIDLLEAAGMA